MWAAWILVGTGATLAAGPALWLRRMKSRPSSLTGHLGGLLLVYSILFMVSAIQWLPPLKSVVTVEQAGRNLPVAAPNLSCDDVARAIPMLERVSNGLIVKSDDGSLIVAGEIWSALPSAHRSRIIALIQHRRECISGERPSVVVRESITGEVLISTSQGLDLR